MDARIKAMVVIGTRPEAIKLCPVVTEFKRRPDKFEPIVLVTGQHREMLDQVLQVFDVAPDHDLNLMEPNQTLPKLTSKSLLAIGQVIANERPDYVIVQGDTTTSFVASLAAFYEHTAVCHVEAGLRTYKKYSPFPEEVNRSLISVLADLHFAPTQTAANALLREGISEDTIYVTGNTVIDALFHTLNGKSKQSAPSEADGIRRILLTAHRRENFGAPMVNICQAVRELADTYEDVEFVFPVHKNPNVRSTVYEYLTDHDRVRLIEPADYTDFVALMDDAYFILTDSGGVQEEAPSLGKPVLVLRNDTERPEAVDAGTVRVIGTDKARIVSEAGALLNDHAHYCEMSAATNPYGDGKSSPRIADILISHKHAATTSG